MTGNLLTITVQFQEEIKQLLERHGLQFSSEETEACSILSVEKAGDGSIVSTPVRIILIPLTATDPDAARRQSIAVSQMAGSPDTIAVTEDRWRKATEMMSGRILAHTRIFRSVYARDCEVRKINRGEADRFLEKAHSYGGAKCRYSYGVFLKRDRVKNVGGENIPAGDSPSGSGFTGIRPGAMVAAAEFSNSRRWIKDGREIRSYEWIRYASMPDVRITGGMGKVLSRFIDDVRPDDIMSYADIEWSAGQAYSQLGFVREEDKGPVLFTVDTDTWTRVPIRDAAPEPEKDMGNIRYFQNFGSRKYRLKLY